MEDRLNEVLAHYTQEGWDHFYLVVTGSDCNIILDMFSEIFGPPSWVQLEYLDEPSKKRARTEAAAFEKAVLKQEGVPDTSKVKTVYPTSTTMSYTIGAPVDYFPTTHQAEEPSKATGQMVGCMYYHCTIYPHRSQNQDNTYMHTHCHLNVVIGCAWPNCTKTYDDSKRHGGLLLPGALSKGKAKAVIAGLVVPSSQ